MFTVQDWSHRTFYRLLGQKGSSKVEQDRAGGLTGECVVYPGDQIEITKVAQFFEVALSPNC